MSFIVFIPFSTYQY